MNPASQAFSVSAVVAVEAEEAFAFLADGMNQRYWALGSWNRRRLGEDLFAGNSLFDGTELLIRVVPRRDLLLVDFETGTSPEALDLHVEARVIPGATLGHPASCCLVVLTVFRGAGTDDALWTRFWHVFETEIQMIKGRLEIGFR